MTGRRFDLVVGAAGAGTGAASVALAGFPAGAAAAGAVIGGALGLVRTATTAAWLLAAAAFAVLATFMDGAEIPFATFILFCVHPLGAGRFARTRVAAVLALAGLLATAVGAAIEQGGEVPAVFIPLTAWIAGRAVRERAVLAERLAERAAELEAERDAYARLSVRYERSRIAAELHDIVAHAISVMVVQAAAGQRLVDHDPDAAREAFASIGDAARQAEADMGALVDMLADRSETGSVPDLTELIARLSGAGLDVTLRLEGDCGPLAYRVVQESLTNALRYAAGAAVNVTVRGDEVEIVNGPAPNAPELADVGLGSGLQGLRDRLGGRLEAGPTPDGGWRVQASCSAAAEVRPRRRGRR